MYENPWHAHDMTMRTAFLRMTIDSFGDAVTDHPSAGTLYTAYQYQTRAFRGLRNVRCDAEVHEPAF